MADYILSAENYPSVRAAIGVEIDTTMLPDEVLSLPIYKDEAERFIMRNLTEAQYTAEETKDEADYAAILYLASLVAPTLRIVQQEKLVAGQIVYERTDLKALAERLREQAMQRINDVINQTTSDSETNPNFFGVAHRVFYY